MQEDAAAPETPPGPDAGGAPQTHWLAGWRGMLLVAIVAFAGCVAPTFARGLRTPRYHDEFSQLLAGETFAKFRLTNPPHPMWQHFETFHEIFQPTYMSKYPPGQGLVIAVGQLLTGVPDVGIWLSVSLMAVAITWALRAWLPPAWAVGGGLFTGIMFGGFSTWGSEFWGGALTAMGGALVLGALRRLVDRPRRLDGVMLALGLGTLAFTRPFEGLVFSAILTAGYAIVWFRRPERPWRALVSPAYAFGLVMLAFLTFALAYNHAVTGKFTELPYAKYAREYDSIPTFWFVRDTGPKSYRLKVIEDFYAPYRRSYARDLNLSAVARAKPTVSEFVWFYLRRPKLIPILGLLIAAACLLKLRLVAPSVAVAGTVLAQTSVTYYFPHYSAPVLAGVIVPTIAGLWAGWEWAKRRGVRVPALAEGVLLAAISLGGPAFVGIREAFIPRPPAAKSLADLPANIKVRPQFVNFIQKAGARDGSLVFVSYSPGHIYDEEWVYNAADIDASPVVWAHDLGTKSDAELIEYYRRLGQDRRIWRITVGDPEKPLIVKESSETTLTPSTVPASVPHANR